jgi:hypothetical protein
MSSFANRIIRSSEPKPFVIGKVPFDLSFLPPGMGIDAAFVVLDGALNVPAAGVTSVQLQRLLDDCQQERRIRAGGLGQQTLDHLHRGRRALAPAAIAVGAAQAAQVAWPLVLRDSRAIDPTDHPPATDYYQGKTLDCFFIDPTTILAALAVNAGTNVYLEFHLSPLSTGKVPTSSIVSYVDVVGKQTKLPGGLRYIDMVLVKNDGSNISDAELGNARLTIDGNADVFTRTRLAALAREFNRHVAAEAAGAIDPAAAGWVPVLHPLTQYKGTKLPAVREVLEFNYDGTLAANVARLYFRAIEERSESAVIRGGQKLWGKTLGDIQGAVPKTASKNGVSQHRGFISAMAHRVFGKGQ